jgi:hypothetical protein
MVFNAGREGIICVDIFTFSFRRKGHKMVNNSDTVDCFNRKKRTIERVVSRQHSVGMEKILKIYIFMTRTMFGEQKIVNCRNTSGERSRNDMACQKVMKGMYRKKPGVSLLYLILHPLSGQLTQRQ